MGYLMVDDRASGGKLQEFETVNCRHCNGIIKVVHGQRDGAWCMTCAGPVHNTERCAARCTPFFRKVEENLRKQAFFKAIGLGG